MYNYLTVISQVGVPGHAGEYIVQEGFGWTNGVILHFLSQYGDVIESEDDTMYNNPKRYPKSYFSYLLMLLGTSCIVTFLLYFLKKKRCNFILLPVIAFSHFVTHSRHWSK